MDDLRYRSQDIYLKDIVWNLLLQWRGIVLTGIVCAVAVVIIMHIKGSTDSVVVHAPEENSVAADDETYRELSVALSKYTTYICAKNRYETSFWNTNDYDNTKSVTCVFRYDRENASNDLYSMTGLYSSMSGDDRFNEKLVNAANNFWNDIAIDSLYQIMTIEITQDNPSDNPETGSIRVTMILPDKAEASEWKESLIDAITSYCEDNKDITGTSVPKLVMMSFGKTDYMRLSETQNLLFGKYMSSEEDYAKTLTALSEAEQTIVRQVVDETGESYNIKDYIIALERTIESSKTKGNDPAELSSDGSYVSKIKYLLLGFVIGCIIYSCVYMAIFIFGGVIHNENELYNATGISNFGGVYEYPYGGKFNTFLHDRRVYKRIIRSKKTIERISEDVISKLRFSGKDSLTIIYIGKVSETGLRFAKEQIKILEDNQIKTSSLNVDDTVDAVKESLFSDIECALIVILGNRTKWRELCRMCFKLAEYDTCLVGTEYYDV